MAEGLGGRLKLGREVLGTSRHRYMGHGWPQTRQLTARWHEARGRGNHARPTGQTAMHTLARSCIPSASTCDPKTWAGGPYGPAAAVAASPIAALASRAKIFGLGGVYR